MLFRYFWKLIVDVTGCVATGCNAIVIIGLNDPFETDASNVAEFCDGKEKPNHSFLETTKTKGGTLLKFGKTFGNGYMYACEVDDLLASTTKITEIPVYKDATGRTVVKQIDNLNAVPITGTIS